MKADHDDILRLLKTARGQIDGLIRMVDDDRYCLDISNQVLATQKLLGTTNRKILAAHLDSCVRDAFAHGDPAEQDKKIAEVMTVIEKLSR